MMDSKSALGVPQLSNEMQLKIMNKVKSGELSIEDALKQAENIWGSQENFSVYKFNRYRWQKRILQIDFNTKMVCSIEKGIVKRQIPFFEVKSCDDGPGAKFSVLFRGRPEYELEATSLEDKYKIMQLVNRIIQGNINDIGGQLQTPEKPSPPRSLHQGQLYLQRGGLASFKWVKYTAQLHESQLTLQPTGQQMATSSDGYTSPPLPIIIHFSDGNVRVEKLRSCDTFSVLTRVNEYLFRVPVMDEMKGADAVMIERDKWVQDIARQCMAWKRCSQSENQTIYETIVEAMSSPFTLLVEEAECVGSFDEDTLTLPPAPPSPKPCASPKPPVLVPVFPMPPPPPPTAPAPPPLPSKSSSKPISKRTKAFHWDPINQDKLGKSLWTRRDLGNVQIDTSRLYGQFGIQDFVYAGGLESNSNLQIMLNQKVAHNFNIFLKSFPVKPGELKDKLCIVHEEDGGLSDEQIASLRRYVPTSDDIEMFKSYKGSPSELHMVDQYMLEMCNIPYLSGILDLLLLLRELPVSMEDLQPLVSQKIRMCSQLYNCRSFVTVLEYLLAIGNYLNENAGKEKAKGFRLSTLTKLSQLRGKDRKFTLMHALVEQIRLHGPQVAVFFQELAEFETVPGASIKGLTAEVDVLKNELQKVIQYKKTYKRKNQGTQHQKFMKDLKTAIERISSDLSQMTKKCEEMKKLYADILVKFGEPLEQDSQELFRWVGSFIAEFRKIYTEAVQ
ncbi:formin-F [Brienomyrus brachyistius]|uniref:formin-F n=1 Tax=Brienomyrus brachyistius TaxID=42636 RepID=UPI0020B362BF|nr:formin-F [Brienomyrus brachyistius]